MKRILFLTTATIFLASCATYEAPTLSTSKTLDFTHSKVAAEEYWIPAKLVSPKYPVSIAKNRVAGCSRFKISINSDGKTVNAELIEAYPTDAFIAPSVAAVKKWVWKPTSKNKERIEITRMVQLDFYIPDAKNYAQAKGYCAVGTQF
ncbi:energy transducer TonB [Alteromonas sp. A081]|uniref:energy transducer TonB n=1 Tax=Alteromonas sp. A081 TaxID=3410269 RepID=UPI003B984CDC